MSNGNTGVEVVTEQGTRFFPFEEEVHLIPSITRVRAATTTALAANTRTGNVIEANSNGAIGTIDGVTDLDVGDLLLDKDHATGANRGVFEILSPGSSTSKFKLRRAASWDVSARVKSMRLVLVEEGTENGGETFQLTTANPIVLNTTTLTFTGDGIQTAEIANGAVTNDKLGADAVNGAKLADDAVNSEHIAAGAIDPEHFAALSVETAAIAAGAVTAAKFANGAGVAALLAAGLGNSINVDNAAGAPASLLAADAVNDRAVIVVVVVTEVLATTAEFAVATVGGLSIRAVPTLTALGAVLVGAATVPASVADSEIVVTPTAGATGTISVTVIALPTA